MSTLQGFRGNISFISSSDETVQLNAGSVVYPSTRSLAPSTSPVGATTLATQRSANNGMCTSSCSASREGDVAAITRVHVHGHRADACGGDEADIPFLVTALELPPTPARTSAVTRSWSDVDPTRLFVTFACTSFFYSLIGHPLFLAIARQQCHRGQVSARQILSEAYCRDGVRGLFRGAGASISGTIVSELVYYFLVEYGKEKLPLAGHEWRSFGSGLLADVGAAPIFNPFAVVSQVQMVAGSSFACEHNYMPAVPTAVTLVKEQGMRCLLRGTLLTMFVAPLTGAWWFVYEFLKRHTYAATPTIARLIKPTLPSALQRRLPQCCTSHTDNVLVNCGVGAAASMVLGVVMNPIYVLRLRLQVQKTVPSTRFPVVHLMRDILRNEGAHALWKGLGANLVVAVAGGCAFGMTYESTKRFADVTVKNQGTRFHSTSSSELLSLPTAMPSS